MVCVTRLGGLGWGELIFRRDWILGGGVYVRRPITNRCNGMVVTFDLARLLSVVVVTHD